VVETEKTKSNSSKVSALVSGNVNRTAIHPTIERDVKLVDRGEKGGIRTHAPGSIVTEGSLGFECFEQ
jgi:hypothetical protein